MTDFESKLKRLQEPFALNEIEWRIGQHGADSSGKIWCKVLAYVQSRAIMQRLDETVGPLNWRNEFREWHGDSQLCGISIRDPETNEWITKWNGADNTDIESTKGGLSDAEKRAAVEWGIGRYLYKLPETWVDDIQTERPSQKDGWNYAFLSKDAKTNKSNKDIRYYWHRPQLPDWAMPGGLPESPEPKKPGKKQKQPDTKDELKRCLEWLEGEVKCTGKDDLAALLSWLESNGELKDVTTESAVKNVQHARMLGRALKRISEADGIPYELIMENARDFWMRENEQAEVAV